ncbi:MAG: Rho termination factor N-terminal domain-containing protein, partial [Rhodoferax sp.]|nr:Rho termination factor N-terminal domain-containing protein [Actinomycetota bacterium]
MTDTTDLLEAGASAPAGQDDATTTGTPAAAPRTRRRATSGGLAALVLPELQAMAGELGITGVGRLRKSQLIEAIQAAQSANGAPAVSTPAVSTPAVSTPAVERTTAAPPPSAAPVRGAASPPPP